MTRISYKRRRFPQEVIQHSVWLHFRFTLSLRDVEEMLAQRRTDVNYETIRCWTIKFGPKIVANPTTARSQVIGGMTMGVGAALMEELAVDKRHGYFVNHDLAGYEVPAHADIPH